MTTGREAATDRAWWHGAVFYQIYPRSFADANGDGIGDLPGVLRHLDHLASGASGHGADAIWLSPFYSSQMTDFGYDIADHCGIDPVFGSLGVRVEGDRRPRGTLTYRRRFGVESMTVTLNISEAPVAIRCRGSVAASTWMTGRGDVVDGEIGLPGVSGTVVRDT